jgi:hypothetical protein
MSKWKIKPDAPLHAIMTLATTNLSIKTFPVAALGGMSPADIEAWAEAFRPLAV